MMADLRQIPDADRLWRFSEAVRATGLEEHLTRPIGELSKGFRQRVGLAQAILHKPKLLILDEPTVGLDPTQIVEVRRLIRRLAETSTVLLSTHILSEVEATCGRVIILLNGEVKADASLSELATTDQAVLVLSEAPDDVVITLEALPEVQSVEVVQVPDGRAYHVRGGGVDLRPLLYQVARDRDWPLRELHREVRTLETVFGELTRGTVDLAAAGESAGAQELAEAIEDDAR
jgi:ABC-2 type transport system ATP-binding protein